jgi:CHAT domain-containing protein
MRHVAASLVLAAVLAGSAGCTQWLVPEEDKLLPAGRYSELERLMEGQVTSLTAARSNQLMYLCFAYSRLKKYDKLFPCLDQLDRNVQAGDFRVNFFDMSAWAPMLRGEAYLELGDYAKAIAEAQKAYDVAVEKDLHRSTRIFTLGPLALAYALAGDRTRALKYAAALEDIGTFYPFILLKTPKYTQLAKIYAALGDYQKSLAAIREIDTQWFEAVADLAVFATGGTSSVNTWMVVPREVLFAKALLETGQVAEARERYDALLRQRETAYNGELYWLALFDRGRIAERDGQLQQAIDLWVKAVDVIERQRSTINTEVNKIGFVGDKQEVYRRLIGALVETGQPRTAFEYAERSKSRALVDLLAAKSDYAVRTAEAGQVRVRLAQLAAAEAAARVQETTATAAELQARQLRSIAVTEQLRTATPELASLVTVTRVVAGDIQPLLGADETLVEYYYQGDDAWAFVLTRGDVAAVRLDGRGLRADVAALRQALEDPDSATPTALAQRVYRRLVAPLEGRVTTKNVLVVAHGVLHYFPFAALHDGQGHLIERASLRYVPSASVLPYLAQRAAPATRRLLALGNPDVGDVRYDLRFAEEETLAIAATFADARVLVRGEATKAAFARLALGASHIHFAGHGRFDSDTPMASGLMLAAARPGDGFLSLGELYSLQLDADLVTLSACETGLGKVQNGDDVVGLARGFLYAGSRAIVASLWKVDDRATSYLMTRFYENLKSLGKRDALREAQLATKARYPHPFFWAAFQLTGLAD